ncbi:MAG: OB-fold domain-containing protein [Burkholderiales bacterium]|nr:OB-fold domain-containing protein [Burkholderiales bacterium]
MSQSALSTPFTDGLAQGRVRYQRCAHCGAVQRLARHACTTCGATTLEWFDAQGGGQVFALTEIRRAPTDAFKALVPYTLALVDLDEGARVMGHAEAGLAIGDRVQAGVFALDGQPLIRFTRSATPGA